MEIDSEDDTEDFEEGLEIPEDMANNATPQEASLASSSPLLRLEAGVGGRMTRKMADDSVGDKRTTEPSHTNEDDSHEHNLPTVPTRPPTWRGFIQRH